MSDSHSKQTLSVRWAHQHTAVKILLGLLAVAVPTLAVGLGLTLGALLLLSNPITIGVLVGVALLSALSYLVVNLVAHARAKNSIQGGYTLLKEYDRQVVKNLTPDQRLHVSEQAYQARRDARMASQRSEQPKPDAQVQDEIQLETLSDEVLKSLKLYSQWRLKNDGNFSAYARLHSVRNKVIAAAINVLIDAGVMKGVGADGIEIVTEPDRSQRKPLFTMFLNDQTTFLTLESFFAECQSREQLLHHTLKNYLDQLAATNPANAYKVKTMIWTFPTPVTEQLVHAWAHIDQSELDKMIQFRRTITDTMRYMVNRSLQPVDAFTRNETYIVHDAQGQARLVAKKATHQAQINELAAREMSEIMGFSDITQPTVVRPLVSQQLQHSRTITKEDGVVDQARLNQQAISRTTKPGQQDDSGSHVLMQQFIQNSQTVLSVLTPPITRLSQQMQQQLQIRAQRMDFATQRRIGKAAMEDPAKIYDFIDPRSLRLTLNGDDRAKMILLSRQINQASLQRNALRAFLLGEGDCNFGNIMLVRRGRNSEYNVLLIDFEEIMPENNVQRLRQLPLIEKGTSNLFTGAVKVSQLRDKPLEGVMSLMCGLLCLPVAQNDFDQTVLQEFVDGFDIEALKRYHRATQWRNGFSHEQIQAQLDRAQYLVDQCQGALNNQANFSPRNLYDHFYQQHPEYTQAREKLSNNMVFYQLTNRIGIFADNKSKKSVTAKTQTFAKQIMTRTVKAQIKAAMGRDQMDASMPKWLLRDRHGAAIAAQFESDQLRATYKGLEGNHEMRDLMRMNNN